MNVLIAEPHEVFRYGLHTIFAQDPRVLNVYEAINKEELHDCMISFQFDLLVVNQSLMSDIFMLKLKKIVVLTSKPNIGALKDAYRCGALGYLSTDVSAELLCTFLNPSQKSFLIEPTLGPWLMETVFHLFYPLSSNQPCTSRKSLCSVFFEQSHENRATELYLMTENLMMLIWYLHR